MKLRQSSSNQDSTLADNRFYILYPNEASAREEIRQVLLDYMYHTNEIAALGFRKGFYHVNEASKLRKTLTRWLDILHKEVHTT